MRLLDKLAAVTIVAVAASATLSITGAARAGEVEPFKWDRTVVTVSVDAPGWQHAVEQGAHLWDASRAVRYKVLPAPDPKADVQVVVGRESQFGPGMYAFAVGPYRCPVTCTAEVTINPAAHTDPASTLATAVAGHELGHVLGLKHRATPTDDIMSPGVADGASPDDEDFQALAVLYGVTQPHVAPPPAPAEVVHATTPTFNGQAVTPASAPVAVAPPSQPVAPHKATAPSKAPVVKPSSPPSVAVVPAPTPTAVPLVVIERPRPGGIVALLVSYLEGGLQ